MNKHDTMRAMESTFAVSPDAYQQGLGGGPNIRDFLWVLRRGWLLPVLGALLGLAAGLGYIAFVPETYKSSARIILDRSVNRYLESNKIINEPSLDDVDMGSQIYVLLSDSIIVPVVRSLDLAHDPEFVGRRHDPSKAAESCAEGTSFACVYATAKSDVKKVVEFAKETIGWKTEPPLDPETALERTAVEKLLSRLTVFREDVPNVISITFASEDPKKAANVANAIADTYISTTRARKLESNKMVGQLLEDRLMDLKQQSTNADRALLDFKTAHNLASSVPDNQLITRLRSQYVDLAAKVNQLEDTVGPTHFAVLKLRKQMDELDAAIGNEEQRIAASSDFGAPPQVNTPDNPNPDAPQDENRPPETRSDEFNARWAKLDGQTQAKFRELDSSARTLRTLYTAALRKFNELNQNRPETEDAHIISRAAPPLRKTSNKALLVLAGGIVFGFCAGLGTALFREWAADVFRTPEQVKNATGIYCTVLPSAQDKKSEGLEDHVLDAPFSRFAETLRNLRALINASPPARGGKIICVVSSVSQEGKTTIASNLASLISASSTSRTLIVDCDLHRRKVTADLVPDARVGLIEALADPSQLAKLVSKRQRSGVDVLPCALTERLPHISELLGSPQMEKLLDAARDSYDFIVIEVAPIMSVVDMKMIERFIDCFVFVIEWGVTKRRLVDEALFEAEMIRDRIVCMVLNKADPSALRSIESYKGSRMADYYIG